MKTILTMISAGLLLIATSCQKSQDVQPANDNASTSERGILSGNNLNVSATSPTRIDERVVYFNNNRYAVRLQASALPPQEAGTTGGMKVNTFYVIREEMGTKNDFLGILNALPGKQYSPLQLWQVVTLDFIVPYTKPYQLTSADQVAKLLSNPTSGMIATKTTFYFQMQMAPLADQPAAIQ
jgi:hypothetical protein